MEKIIYLLVDSYDEEPMVFTSEDEAISELIDCVRAEAAMTGCPEDELEEALEMIENQKGNIYITVSIEERCFYLYKKTVVF